MATKKRTRNASGAAASQSKRRVGASTRRAGASTRPKKGSASKKRGASSSRAAPKAPPERVGSKRTAKGAVKRGAKSIGGVIKKTTKRRGAGGGRKSAGAAQAKGLRASAARRSKADVNRRDGAGHIDPQYAADLLAQRGTSDRDEGGTGFVGQSHTGDDLAENLAEEFVASATSGENQEEEILDQEVPEERGGPFVESTAGTEFAWGTDASNPKNAKREPFPTT